MAPTNEVTDPEGPTTGIPSCDAEVSIRDEAILKNNTHTARPWEQPEQKP